MTKKVEHCSEALESLADFVDEFSPLVNACMVDFITRDVFGRLVPRPIGEELLQMSAEEVARMPKRLEEGGWRGSHGEVDKLMARLAEHGLDSLGVVEEWKETDVEEEQGDGGGDPSTVLKHLDRIMGDKKMHEVLRFAGAIHGWRSDRRGGFFLRTLVDLGSGKGYLGQILSSVLCCDVLAVDAAEGNTHGAEKRAKNLDVS